MGDAKSAYSEMSGYYVNDVVPSSAIDQGRYDRSKAREERFNESWKRNPVNINDICDRFAPGDMGHQQGVKYIFESEQYEVKADMASGYLRIYDKVARSYVTLDGIPSDNLELTHFKILRREEM